MLYLSTWPLAEPTSAKLPQAERQTAVAAAARGRVAAGAREAAALPAASVAATRSFGGTRETCPAAEFATRQVRATGSPSWAVTTLAQSRSRVCFEGEKSFLF